MRIPSPNQNKPFRKIVDGKGYHYDQTRQEQIVSYKPLNPLRPDLGVVPVTEVIDVPIGPEVTDLNTGESNSQYFQPDMVLNPSGCSHEFIVEDMGKREVVCSNCGLGVTFHVGMNYQEEDGQGFILLNKKMYPVRA